MVRNAAFEKLGPWFNADRWPFMRCAEKMNVVGHDDAGRNAPCICFDRSSKESFMECHVRESEYAWSNGKRDKQNNRLVVTFNGGHMNWLLALWEL